MRRLAVLAALLLASSLSQLAAFEMRASASFSQGVVQSFHFIDDGTTDVRTSFSSNAFLSVLAGENDTLLIGPRVGFIFNSRMPALERMFYSGYMQVAGGLEARIALCGPFSLGLGAMVAIGRYEDVDVTISSLVSDIALLYVPIDRFSLAPSIQVAFNGSDVALRIQLGFSITSKDML